LIGERKGKPSKGIRWNLKNDRSPSKNFET